MLREGCDSPQRPTFQASTLSSDSRPGRLRPDETNADTVEVIAVGPSGGLAAYQAAVSRLGQD